jgi:uncharacterized protein
MYETGTEVFNTYKKFALLGASADHARFGYEVFEAFHKNAIPLMPINPKYPDIDGQPCYPSLAALPERPEVVIVALGPAVTEKVMPEVIASGAQAIWMPPGCFNEAAVKICQDAGVRELHDICPVATLGFMCAKA